MNERLAHMRCVVGVLCVDLYCCPCLMAVARRCVAGVGGWSSYFSHRHHYHRIIARIRSGWLKGGVRVDSSTSPHRLPWHTICCRMLSATTRTRGAISQRALRMLRVMSRARWGSRWIVRLSSEVEKSGEMEKPQAVMTVLVQRLLASQQPAPG